MAIEGYNQRRTSNQPRLDLIIEDMQSDKVSAVTATTKLIEVDDVKIIVGATWLESFQSAVPVMNKNDILTVSASGLISAIENHENYKSLFSLWYRADKEPEVLLRHLNSKGVKKIALITENEPYWQNYVDYFDQHTNEKGIEIATQVKFEPGENDFRTILTKVNTLDVDAVVFAMLDPGQALLFTKQANELGLDKDMYTFESVVEYMLKTNSSLMKKYFHPTRILRTVF